MSKYSAYFDRIKSVQTAISWGTFGKGLYAALGYAHRRGEASGQGSSRVLGA